MQFKLYYVIQLNIYSTMPTMAFCDQLYYLCIKQQGYANIGIY